MISKTKTTKANIITGVIFIAIAAAFIISWLGPCAEAWNRLDLKVFRLLNDPLEGDTAWSYFWAFANWRGFDTIGFIFIALFAIHWLRAKGKSELPHRLMVMASYVAIIGIFWTGAEIIEETGLGPEGRVSNRPAPSRVTENDGSGFNDITYRMSWAKSKVKSDNSFPSDHAFLSISMVAFFIMYASVAQATASVFILGFLSIPRMFSGAHWMTDVIGGLCGVCLVVAISLFTATIRTKLIYYLEKKGEIHINRIAKVFSLGLK